MDFVIDMVVILCLFLERRELFLELFCLVVVLLIIVGEVVLMVEFDVVVSEGVIVILFELRDECMK